MYRDHDLGKRLRATQEAAGNLLFNRMKLAQGEQRAHARHEHKSQQSTERQKQDRAEPVLGQTRPRRFLRKSVLVLIRVHVSYLAARTEYQLCPSRQKLRPKLRAYSFVGTPSPHW